MFCQEEKEKSENKLYDVVFIGLTTDRELLYDRINKRVDKMVADGLIEEAKSLYDLHIDSRALLTPICYKELFMYFEGVLTLNESLDLIRQRSRKYAKRQYTWFNNQMDVKWFDVDFNDFNKELLYAKVEQNLVKIWNAIETKSLTSIKNDDELIYMLENMKISNFTH